GFSAAVQRPRRRAAQLARRGRRRCCRGPRPDHAVAVAERGRRAVPGRGRDRPHGPDGRRRGTAAGHAAPAIDRPGPGRPFLDLARGAAGSADAWFHPFLDLARRDADPADTWFHLARVAADPADTWFHPFLDLARGAADPACNWFHPPDRPAGL